MKQVIDAVIKELQGKNPGRDVIKMCLRVAMDASGFEFTHDEWNKLYDECALALAFDPLDERGPLLVKYAEEA